MYNTVPKYLEVFNNSYNLSGEARYFIEEFQNRRKGSEFVKLAECEKIIERHCSETLPDAAASADTNLAILDKKVLHLTQVNIKHVFLAAYDIYIYICIII